MKKYVLAAALCFGIAASAFAQEEKLVVKPSGRILMDGAIMHSSDDAADAAGEAGHFMGLKGENIDISKN